MTFTLMENSWRLDVMHYVCGREADPPVLRGTPGWRSVASVTDMPEQRQRDIRCAWCGQPLAAQARP